jgi:hypothetical protein
MRLMSLIAATFFLALSGSAFAQEWVEFKSVEDRFTANFPGQPTITQTTYTSQFGADLPARVYSATQGQSRYSLTVVDFNQIEKILADKAKACPPGAETCRGGGSSTGPGYSRADYNGAIIYATWQLMQRDAKVTHLLWNNIDLVGGHQIHLTNRDGSRTLAAIYMHDQKLYIVEGTVPDGYPEPGLFQQSLAWLDANGNGIRYQTLYHHAFPPPPAGRGGQGQGPAQGGGGRGRGGQP